MKKKNTNRNAKSATYHKKYDKIYTRYTWLSIGLFSVILFVLMLLLNMMMDDVVWYLVVITYYVAINLTTYLVFYLDKNLARSNKIRVPEKVLHYLEFAGGGLGSFWIQKKIHHKNKKSKFNVVTFVAAFVHIFVIVILFTISYLVSN